MKPFYLHSLLLLAGGILGRRFLTMPAFGKNPENYRNCSVLRR